MWYPRPVRLENVIWDLLFYDFGCLSSHQFYAGWNPFVEPGAVIVISPDKELNSNTGFELFASEKIGGDRLSTSRQRAQENVDRLLKQYGGEIDTVAVAGCGSSLVGALAFGKTVAKARKNPVAAIVSGLGMRDLIAQVILGALLFRPANLAWGDVDRFLKQIRDTQREVQRSVQEGVSSVVPLDKTARKKVSNAGDRLGDSLHDNAKDMANTVRGLTEHGAFTFADALVNLLSFMLPFGQQKSLNEVYLNPSWPVTDRGTAEEEAILAAANLIGEDLDNFVDGLSPACATLHEFLKHKDHRLRLLVGHSLGAYAIISVAWAMMYGNTEDGVKKALQEKMRIVSFGCGASVPFDLKNKVYQYIGEWDILGNLNTPGVHIPFLPREWSLAPETLEINWLKGTLHTTSTLNLFRMPVVDILEGRGGRSLGRGETKQAA